MLFPLYVLSLAVMQTPAPRQVAEAPRAVDEVMQEPTKPAPKATPKQQPKSAQPSPPSRAAPSRPSPGAARPQAPRPNPGKPGGTPKATGEPKLKRRGS